MALANLEIPTRPKRVFLPEDFVISTWEALEPFFEDLLEREISSGADLLNWFKDKSELEAILSEEGGWRYIKMTCDTTDKEASERYQFFVSQIQPKVQPYSDKLNKKALASEFLTDLEEDGIDIMVRDMKTSVELFREENIPLFVEIRSESQKFGAISGAMTVEVDGKELTLQQASVYLKDSDRSKREEVYRKVSERRYQDNEKLDDLFSKLIELRHKVATNAGFKNFRDYMFKSLGRFDYTPQDCFDFHSAVEQKVVPVLNSLAKERKQKLGVELKPWDLSVDADGNKPLKPFQTGGELINKSIECFNRLDPFLGERLAIMKEMGHLDLESRIGKAPGGYNYPLMEIGVPFIFMNSSGQHRDLVTMVHEGGHAVHSFVTRDLLLTSFKHTPSEVAELASMSMELLSMDHWDVFFENEEDLKRAKKEHLEQIIETLPWVATIDKFQHWIYENPNHTKEDRKSAWNDIFDTFRASEINWDGLQIYKDFVWQKQLHLFEVPFYYIEYAIAQLGAIAVWKNFKENKKEGLSRYMDALRLGYTKSIKEVYETAGVRFDFSAGYISELIEFVKTELNSL